MVLTNPNVSRSLRWGSGGAAIALLATWAITAPIISSQPFDLPMPGQTAPIWNDPVTPPATRVGVSVSADLGTATVKVVVPGNPPTPIGQAMPGNTYVVEGYWQQLNVLQFTGHPKGSAIARGPTDSYTTTDGTVGGGSVKLPATGASASPYKSFVPSPPYRLFLVRPATDPVAVVMGSSPSSPPILTIDGGDWSFAGVNGASQLWLTGKNVVEFGVYDMRAGNAPCAGSAAGIAGEVDSVYVDGSKLLTVTLLSNACPLTVTWQSVGDPNPSVQQVMTGGTQICAGMLTLLQWQYGSPGSVQFQVTAN